MLLGLKPDQFVDVVLFQRRQLHEAGKNRLPRHGVADLFLLHLEGGRQLLDRQGDLRKARHLLGRVRQDAMRTVGLENQSPSFGGVENRHRYSL